MIKIENIIKNYKIDTLEVEVLKNISYTIPDGKFLTIMGPSGSGKTTLLHILGGIDYPTSGRIIIDDENISTLNDNDLTIFRRAKIGFVFQAFNLIPTLSVEKNIALPLLIAGKKNYEFKDKLENIINVLGLSERRHYHPTQLSGGQQQRVAIARGLIINPRILLMDEPTGNLDSKNGDTILALVSEIHKQFKTTIVMVTHNIYAAQYADEVLFLKDGTVADVLAAAMGHKIVPDIIYQKLMSIL